MFTLAVCSVLLTVAAAEPCGYVGTCSGSSILDGGYISGGICGGNGLVDGYIGNSCGVGAVTGLNLNADVIAPSTIPTRSRIVSNNCNCVKTIVSAKPNIREFAVPIRTSRVLTSVRPTYRSEVYTATPCSSSVYPAGGYLNNLAGLGLTNGYVADAGVVGPVVDSYGSSLIGGLGCSGLVPSVGDSYGAVLTGCGAPLIGGCDVPVSSC